MFPRLIALAAFFFFVNKCNAFGGDLLNDMKNVAKQVGQNIQSAVKSQNGKFVKELEKLGKEIERKVGEECMEMVNDDESIIRLHNWAGNFNYSTLNIQYPRNVAEVQQIVRKAKKLRVLGQRHSFSKIADSPFTMLSTLGLNRVIQINSTIPSVTVQAGITYNELGRTLNSAGYALANLAALAEISVGGAISTGTHGSGLGVSNLATQVRSLQLVLANGTIANYSSTDPEFKALAVGLGAFGVITQVELNIQPTYSVQSNVFLNLPAEAFYEHFEEIENLGFNALLTSTLANLSNWETITLTTKVGADSNNVTSMTELYGATRVPSTANSCGDSSQSWNEGLILFRTGIDGDDLQTEFFVPLANAVAAIKAARNLRDQLLPVVSVMVIRTIKSDDFWMSPQSGENDGGHVAIHFSWDPTKLAQVAAVLPAVHEALAPFGARPHWGKFNVPNPRQFLPTYPKLNEFKKLVRNFDPTGKFRNQFMEENVFADIE